MKNISSIQNPLIKQILQLREKSRVRKKTGLFVVEGYRELLLALKGSYVIKTVLVQPGIISEDSIAGLLQNINAETDIIEISKEVYQKIAYRTTTEGVLAIGEAREHLLSGLMFKGENPLILVAEAPEKPGNIGALLRTADAAGLDAVIIANPRTDLFNPNIIRSSVGCVFTSRIAMGTTMDIIRFLKEKNIAIYSAALTASVLYHTVDFKQPSAIVVGTEAQGLGEAWLYNSTKNIIIPMQGEIDSMNMAVAASVLIFEAKRQRGFCN